jgi:hypothetical protein
MKTCASNSRHSARLSRSWKGPAYRRRCSRSRLLLRHRAGEGQGDQGAFDDDESERLLRGFLSKGTVRRRPPTAGPTRRDPVIQLAPLLTIGQPGLTRSNRFCGMCSEAWTRLPDGTLLTHHPFLLSEMQDPALQESLHGELLHHPPR